jgi:hypothetical protein
MSVPTSWIPQLVPLASKKSTKKELAIYIYEVQSADIVWPLSPNDLRKRYIKFTKPPIGKIAGQFSLDMQRRYDELNMEEIPNILKQRQINKTAMNRAALYDWNFSDLYAIPSTRLPFKYLGLRTLSIEDLVNNYLIVVRLKVTTTKKEDKTHYLFCVKVDDSHDLIHLPSDVLTLIIKYYDKPDARRPDFMTQRKIIREQKMRANPKLNLNSDEFVLGDPFQTLQALQQASRAFNVEGSKFAQGGQPLGAGGSDDVMKIEQCDPFNDTHGSQRNPRSPPPKGDHAKLPVTTIRFVNIGKMELREVPNFCRLGDEQQEPADFGPLTTTYKFEGVEIINPTTLQPVAEQTLQRVAQKIHSETPSHVKFFAPRHDKILGSHSKEREFLTDRVNIQYRDFKRLESIADSLPHEMLFRDVINLWTSKSINAALNAYLLDGYGLANVEKSRTVRKFNHDDLHEKLLEESLVCIMCDRKTFDYNVDSIFNAIDYNRRTLYESLAGTLMFQCPKNYYARNFRNSTIVGGKGMSSYDYTVYDVHNLMPYKADDRGIKHPFSIFGKETNAPIDWLKAGGKPDRLESEATMEAMLRKLSEVVRDMGPGLSRSECDDLVVLYGIYPKTIKSSSDLPKMVKWATSPFPVNERVDEIEQARIYKSWATSSIPPSPSPLYTSFPELAPTESDKGYKMLRSVLIEKIITTQVEVVAKLLRLEAEYPNPDAESGGGEGGGGEGDGGEGSGGLGNGGGGGDGFGDGGEGSNAATESSGGNEGGLSEGPSLLDAMAMEEVMDDDASEGGGDVGGGDDDDDEFVDEADNHPSRDEIKRQVYEKLHRGRDLPLSNVVTSISLIREKPSQWINKLKLFDVKLLKTTFPERFRNTTFPDHLSQASEETVSQFVEPLLVWMRQRDGMIKESRLKLEMLVFERASNPIPSSAQLRRRRWRQWIMGDEYIEYKEYDYDGLAKSIKTKMFVGAYADDGYPRYLKHDMIYGPFLPERIPDNVKIFLDTGNIDVLESPHKYNYEIRLPDSTATNSKIMMMLTGESSSISNLYVYPTQKAQSVIDEVTVVDPVYDVMSNLYFYSKPVTDKVAVDNPVYDVTRIPIYGLNGAVIGWEGRRQLKLQVDGPRRSFLSKYLTTSLSPFYRSSEEGVDPELARNVPFGDTGNAARIQKLQSRIALLGLEAKRLSAESRDKLGLIS